MSPQEGILRELFIEELAEVNGGGPDKLLQWVADQLQTTYAFCEEGPVC